MQENGPGLCCYLPSNACRRWSALRCVVESRKASKAGLMWRKTPMLRRVLYAPQGVVSLVDKLLVVPLSMECVFLPILVLPSMVYVFLLMPPRFPHLRAALRAQRTARQCPSANKAADAADVASRRQLFLGPTWRSALRLLLLARTHQ